MGSYLQTTEDPHKSKAEQLLTLVSGSQIIDVPPAFDDIPSDMALICVVVNPFFEAAALVYDKDEYKEFTSGPSAQEPRRRTWLLMPKQVAHDRAGYMP